MGRVRGGVVCILDKSGPGVVGDVTGYILITDNLRDSLLMVKKD